jgi:hypothetical protein
MGTIKKWIGVVTFFVVGGLISAHTQEKVSTEGAKTGYKIGSKATDFSLQNIDDKMVSLADYSSAKGFVIVFTCNHCPYAKAYEDRLIALNATTTIQLPIHPTILRT